MSEAKTTMGVQWTIRLVIVAAVLVAGALIYAVATTVQKRSANKHEEIMRCMENGNEPAECRLVMEGMAN